MLSDPGYHPALFARLTGLDVEVLRKYRERGQFTADLVDGRGRRLYAPEQLAQGRLLAALVGTGMTAGRAVDAVRSGDRGAVQTHLTAVRVLLAQAEEHLPARGGAVRTWVERSAVWTVALDGSVETSDDLLAPARSAQRQLADHAGRAVDALPGWESDAPLPDGPVVTLTSAPDGSWRPAALHLALPEGVLAPVVAPGGGEAAASRPWWPLERSTWCALGGPVPADEALDLLLPGGGVDEVARVAVQGEWGGPSSRMLVLSADLTEAAPLVRLL